MQVRRLPDPYLKEYLVFVVDISSQNPHLAVITGNFNAKFTNWSDDDTTTSEGAQFDSLITLYGLKQLIAEL